MSSVITTHTYNYEYLQAFYNIYNMIINVQQCSQFHVHVNYLHEYTLSTQIIYSMYIYAVMFHSTNYAKAQTSCFYDMSCRVLLSVCTHTYTIYNMFIHLITVADKCSEHTHVYCTHD